jgi:O-antigen/teichoic acid export membrane protein
MKLSSNVFAGFAGSAWSAVLALAVVPFYVRYLGVEAYGLIGFFATLQVVLQLLDAGLATTINREVAWHCAAGKPAEARTVLSTVAVIYWSLGTIIGLSIVASAPLIASNWLQSPTIESPVLTRAVMLMGLAVACRWPVALYQGVLIGAQRLAVSSGVQMVMVTVGHAGALSLLAFWSSTIEAFFIWHAGAALAHAFVLRSMAWRALGGHFGERFENRVLQRIWRFSAGMSAAAVAGVLLTQIDKVLLSRMLSLEDFGRYAICAVVASGMYVLITPVFNALYPRLSSLVSRGDTNGVKALYRTGTRLFCGVLFPVGLGVALFAEDLLAVWTGDAGFARDASRIVAFLVLGTTLHGVMHFPYALQLAHGLVRLPLFIATVLAVAMVPLIIYLTAAYGGAGGAAAWLLANAGYLFLGTWLTHRRLLVGVGAPWLLGDVGLPLAVSMLVMAGGAALLAQTGSHPQSHALALAFAAGLVGVAASLTLMSFPDSRRWLRSRLVKV